MISKTKVSDSFPDSQFFLDGFGTPFRLNRNKNGDGIMFYIKMILLQKLFLQIAGLLKYLFRVNFSNEKMAIDLFIQP